jgi:hypothetical protein
MALFRKGQLAVIRKLTFWFALMGYFLTFMYYYGPWGTAYSPFLFDILPFWMCILRIGGMPVQAVALLIAPINALSYGVIGAAIGWLSCRFLGKPNWIRSDQSTPD